MKTVKHMLCEAFISLKEEHNFTQDQIVTLMKESGYTVNKPQLSWISKYSGQVSEEVIQQCIKVMGYDVLIMVNKNSNRESNLKEIIIDKYT